MQLTREQIDQLQEAKERGERRVSFQFTPEQLQEWRGEVARELASKEENIARIRQIMAAAEQPGFLGDVRRALLLSRRPIDELAAAVGVEVRLVSDFRSGETDLPAAALDRLLSSLGLRLMQEIPR